MDLTRWRSTDSIHKRRAWWLKLLNLRPDEAERTFLMFAFYTATSIGVLWLEVSAAALFLNEYGADTLPWIYLASAVIGTGLSLVSNWLQKFLPLRRVIVLIAILMALPLVVFRIGLNPAFMGGYAIFLMRLWLEAIYVLNEVNTSITANQLFTIREIKRTYPLISSGILAADVLSGLSLPFLRQLVGLSNIILMASIMLLIGAAILFYISQTYQSFFPDAPRRMLQENQDRLNIRRLQGPLQRYVILIVVFFVMAQVLFLLIDFQYLSQIENRFLNPNATVQISLDQIADFLALFSATLGIFELLTQWFVSSRAIERLGVFTTAIIQPAMLAVLSTLFLIGMGNLFWGIIILKFLDELLRYTLIASTGPVLFQPIPDTLRSRYQSIIRGVAEPVSVGFTGITMWFVIHKFFPDFGVQSRVILFLILMGSLVWLAAVWFLRSGYLDLLVMSAERGQLTLSDVDLRTFKRAVIEALNRPGTDADKGSCIELLTHIDPKNVGEVLVPLLPVLSPRLQRQGLEAMLDYPNLDYLPALREFIERSPSPEVLAVALRYVWLTEEEPDGERVRPYLKSDVDPIVRGTAASIMLRCGNPQQKAEATDTLRRMLTHKQERERVMGCRALGEAVYLQALRLHIKQLLQDESLRVRCALLEAIAATHLEEFYPSLLRGLHYKSTRESAMRALVRLEDEALPMLVGLAENPHKPQNVRNYAWTAIGKIGTLSAMEVLVTRLTTSWGTTRCSILQILLKLSSESGIEAVANMLGRSGVENLIHQELMFVAQLYAAQVDLSPAFAQSREADLLRRALRDQQDDTIERLFLLMRLLYSSSAIQAAAFNLQSDNREHVARGLEILDNTLDISSKQVVLSILDQRSDLEKLQSLSEYITYTPASPSQRLRHVLDLRHFLSDWTLACCFHLARQACWSLTSEQTLASLRHPVGYVRESVLSYLSLASPRTLKDLLPYLKDDPNSLVASQVEELIKSMGLDYPLADSTSPQGLVGIPDT